jgi:hypothetical protein
MSRKPSTRKHADGKWGLYVGDILLGTAKSETRIELGLKILESAFSDVYEDARRDGYDEGHADGYDEGHAEGYDEGYSDGEFAGGN